MATPLSHHNSVSELVFELDIYSVSELASNLVSNLASNSVSEIVPNLSSHLSVSHFHSYVFSELVGQLFNMRDIPHVFLDSFRCHRSHTHVPKTMCFRH
jgi:hypothetical protein